MVNIFNNHLIYDEVYKNLDFEDIYNLQLTNETVRYTVVDSIRKKKPFNWEYISENKELSEDFIREFQDKVDLKNISAQQKLSEDFIREFKDKVYWCEISCQKLSEDFIREFQDKVHWPLISIFQKKLSEDFIREFQDKVHWCVISIFQKLSEDFKKEFQDKVD